MPLFCHASDDDMRMQTARYLGATKKAILALKKYYKFELSALLTAQWPNPVLPHPTTYCSLDDATIHTFEHLAQLREDKLLFCGAEGIDNVCIKFVSQYSKKANLKCVSLEFAPALRGFELNPGGWYLVVMDFIDDGYHVLKRSPAIASYETKVQEKVTSLHEAGFVHGDIRSVNIMVKKDDSPGIMLIDFDWAGVMGEVRYPMNVNDVDIRRPYGAHDDEPITAEHDNIIIEYMFENSRLIY